MARITTNTTGTQPVIQLNVAGAVTGNLVIPFIQDLTITNSTGVYSYTTFSDADKRKLSTPADNQVSTNIVIDDTTFFGANAAAQPGTSTSASDIGIAKLSTGKVLLDFTIYWAGQTAGTTDRMSTGQGFITSLAAKTSPEAPVWVTPLSIAVDGAITTASNG